MVVSFQDLVNTQSNGPTASEPHTIFSRDKFADMALNSNRYGHEIYDNDQAPSSTPVSLAGLLKRGNRNKGQKNWKPLDLTALEATKSEASLQDSTKEKVTCLLEVEHGSEKVPANPQVIQGHQQNTDISEGNVKGAIEIEVFKKGTVVNGDSEEAKRDHNPLDEINQVFQIRLPDPIFLQENLGSKDGEITFIQHPNRDVSAHQWSSSSFQWINIGQFSHSRRRIEGQLASERLPVDSKIPYNTLAYLRAVSKQRETGSFHLDTEGSGLTTQSLMGPVPLRPKLRIDTCNRGPQYHQLKPLPNASESYNLQFPILGSPSDSKETGHNTTLSGKLQRSEQGYHNIQMGVKHGEVLPAEGFESFGVDQSRGLQHFPNTPVHVQNGVNFGFQFPMDISDRYHLKRGREERERQLYFAQQEQNRIEQTLWPQPPHHTNHLIPITGSTTVNSILTGHPTNDIPKYEATSADNCPSSLRRMPPKYDPDMTIKRMQMKEFLENLSSSAEEQSSQPYFPPGATRIGESDRQQVLDTMLSSSMFDLNISVPDNVQNVKAREIITKIDGHAPTPQNPKGPFFTDSVPTTFAPATPLATHQSDEEALNYWWTSGHQSQRQEDFLRAVVVPSTSLGKPHNYVSSRLLISLYENLVSYVQRQRNETGVFSKYRVPPKHAIEPGENGNDSLLDDGLGVKPPMGLRGGATPFKMPFHPRGDAQLGVKTWNSHGNH